MYWELGEYRIIEYRGVLSLQMHSGYRDVWYNVMCLDNPNPTMEELQSIIFDWRYTKIKNLRRDIKLQKTPKIKYTHP